MSWRQYCFSKLLAKASKYHEPLVAERKAKLFADLRGKVLEIGPGSGVNMSYYPPGIAWTGFEPNPYLARQIEVPVKGKLLQSAFHEAEGENFDFAVSTLVLCSVRDPRQVLRGLFSALRPGGRLLYLEHVAAAAGSPLARSQNRWLPLWRCAADGCCPNRPTGQWIREAGFAIEQEESFTLPLWLAAPHICGIARKP